MHKCYVTLDELTKRKLAVLGGGNLSRGIRIATAHTFERYQAGGEVTGMPTAQCDVLA